MARALNTSKYADDWARSADRILSDTRSRCLHRAGCWQRAADDPSPEAALLLPLARGVPSHDPSLTLTGSEVTRQPADDGYVHRFRRQEQPLGDAEAAFLLCGFTTAMAAHAEGRETEAMRWSERTRSACGPPGLFAESTTSHSASCSAICRKGSSTHYCCSRQRSPTTGRGHAVGKTGRLRRHTRRSGRTQAILEHRITLGSSSLSAHQTKLHGFRHLLIHRERLDNIHASFLGPAVCVLTRHHVQRLC